MEAVFWDTKNGRSMKKMRLAGFHKNHGVEGEVVPQKS